jgi:hypothetical protein
MGSNDRFLQGSQQIFSQNKGTEEPGSATFKGLLRVNSVARSSMQRIQSSRTELFFNNMDQVQELPYNHIVTKDQDAISSHLKMIHIDNKSSQESQEPQGSEIHMIESQSNYSASHQKILERALEL